MDRTETNNPAQPRINVIFRACDAVSAVHNAPRPFGLDKKTLIKICFKSLWNALQGFNFHIVVLGDKLSAEMRDFFLTFNVELLEGTFGNDRSIRETLKTALRFDDDEWVYFCEDDYLHTPDSFQKILTLILEQEAIALPPVRMKQLLRKRQVTLFSLPRFAKKPGLIIFHADYPDRYLEQYNEPSFLFHTTNSHWRQVWDITFTFMAKAGDIKKKRNIIYRAAHRANDRYLSKKLCGRGFFFSKMLCLSPIPSLSTHMHEQTMSPLRDWETLVNKLKQEVA